MNTTQLNNATCTTKSIYLKQYLRFSLIELACVSIFCISAILLFSSFKIAAGEKKPPYKDATLQVEERVTDLLYRMTLEEKIMQFDMFWEKEVVTFDNKQP